MMVDPECWFRRDCFSCRRSSANRSRPHGTGGSVYRFALRSISRLAWLAGCEEYINQSRVFGIFTVGAAEYESYERLSACASCSSAHDKRFLAILTIIVALVSSLSIVSLSQPLPQQNSSSPRDSVDRSIDDSHYRDSWGEYVGDFAPYETDSTSGQIIEWAHTMMLSMRLARESRNSNSPLSKSDLQWSGIEFITDPDVERAIEQSRRHRPAENSGGRSP